ncbi:DISP complex protein LRCH3-like isoform X2 [Mercenaria mercenaria]|uniref:DISP complex protein LRCH3-like isoform X2 n=1 Tax=Mercenaria mercenaria TaxID=6596 RepID=UPI00234EB192|nr:DISP complex protein LRCH3-like isoform X2 [Mercenaria mercenaria]
MLPEMATNYHGGGSQSPTSLSKPIERVFEDAQHTGEINLSCRKLREYPKLAAKYDLIDTISADVSKNRVSEVPKEVCAYISMEKLDCYHNVIKSIPEAIVQLQALTYLNLSRNQLSIIPSFISQLQALEVLIASHNRLVSLPEEIGVLDKLMELDVSCNEISHLPLQIGDLKSLKSLNVRRNFLQELPVEISKLNLRKLDISSNRVSKIPTVFRRIETLEDIILDNNPLTTPPAHVCTKGKQHIMKYLHIIAIREDKARLGMLGEVEMKRFRKSLPPAQSVSSEEFRNLMESPDKWKRHTVLSSDSGYSTTDSVDKCGWSPQEGTAEPQHLIESNNLAIRAAAAVCRDQRIYPPPWEPRREPPEPPQRINSRLSSEKLERPSPPQTLTPGSSTSSKSQISTPPTPPTLYPSNPPTPLTPPTPQGPGPGKAGDAPTILGTSLEDEFTRELQRQKQEYENRKKIAEQLRIQQEEEDEREQRRRAAQRIQDEQQALLNKQREEAEEAKRREEEHRLAEEARKAAEAEARKAEEARQKEEAHRAEELRRQEEARQHKAENNFYFKTNNSYNYNNSNHAWPPPPSPIANQHEARNSPVPSHSEPRSPVSPNQHTTDRTNFHNYSHTPAGYSDHIRASSQGHYGPGQTYRSSGQQSPGHQGHSPSFHGPNHSVHGQAGSGSGQSHSVHGQNHIPHGQSAVHQRHNAGQYGHGDTGQHSPGYSPRSPLYHGQSNEQYRQSPVNSSYSPTYSTSSQEHARHSANSQYVNSYSHSGPSTHQYGQSGQRHVSSELHAQQGPNLHLYQNVPRVVSPNETSPRNISIGQMSYREHSSQHAPMSPLREQAEPTHLGHHSNQEHDHHGHQEHGRYGNQHDSTNSMPLDSYPHYRKPTVSASNSFKEERRPGEGNQPYRRTVSDSNQRLPATSHPNQIQHGQPLTNGPIEEQVSVNGTTSPHQPAGDSLNTSFNSTKSTPPHGAPSVNGPTEDGPKTPQGSGVARRTKPTERGQAPVSKVSKPAARTPGPATSSRSALPTSKRTNLNQDEEIRKSSTNLKSADANKPKADQRLRSIQKDAVNNYMNRRSSGSTSSEDDRKRSTPTRSLALQNPSSASSTSKRSGTGMSGTTRTTTTTTGAKRTNPTSRVTPTTSQTSRRSRQNSTSSTTSVSSTTAKSSVDKSKRSGAVMTSAQVKMLDDYSKEANNPSYTLRRQQDHQKESVEQMEKLRKTISTRLKRSLPENLSEALSDGVLLCHLANQIRPRSVASVHVPSPAVPKLTLPKCRKNVENFLEACRKIGVPKERLCACDDIVDWCRPTSVALLVSELTRLSPLIAQRDVYITYLCLAILIATCSFLYLHAEW